MRTINIIGSIDQDITIHLGGGAIQLAAGCTAHTAMLSPVQTSLEWSKTLLDGEVVTLEEAEKAVAALGNGWRLPTRRELESLIDLTRHDPAIDTDRFPDTKSTWYWTSTLCAWDAAARWVVDFDYGFVHYDRRDDLACVRAVRAGQ